MKERRAGLAAGSLQLPPATVDSGELRGRQYPRPVEEYHRGGTYSDGDGEAVGGANTAKIEDWKHLSFPTTATDDDATSEKGRAGDEER